MCPILKHYDQVHTSIHEAYADLKSPAVHHNNRTNPYFPSFPLKTSGALHKFLPPDYPYQNAKPAVPTFLFYKLVLTAQRNT